MSGVRTAGAGATSLSALCSEVLLGWKQGFFNVKTVVFL